MPEVVFTPGMPQRRPAPPKPALPHPAPHQDTQQPARPAAVSSFSSLDLLAATQEGGLPGLFRLLHDAQERDPLLLSRPMQELLSALRKYMLQPRQLADGQRLKNHLLNSGLFLDGLLESGTPPAQLHHDLKALLNKSLQQLLPHQVLTERSGGTLFEYHPEVTAQMLLSKQKNLHPQQRAIIGKLLQTQTGPLLNEYQQNAETPGQSPVTNRHLATWLGHAVEEALCHIVQQQLHSFSDENQQYWRFSLYAVDHDDVTMVPVEIQHSQADGETWLAGFSLKLGSGNTVRVSLQIDKSTVLVHLEADDFLTHHRLSRRQDRLRLSFRARGLTLDGMTSATMEKEHG
jgi:hypothetical protein